jgi:uncharacterized protein (DUF1015 family)
MALVKSFRGVRPVPRLAAEVAAPPYDVIDSDEARALVEGRPHSFLHISRAEVDLDPSVDPHDPVVYRKGRENLERFMAEGVLIQDARPALYLYRLRMGEHEQTGLYACVSIEEYEAGLIKKHEHTRIDKEMDRAHHIDALNAHTGPVFLMVRANDPIRRLFREEAGREPAYRFVHEYGVEHAFWVVDDEARIRRLTEAFAAAGCLYIADGHHRAAAATRVGQTRRGANAGHTGREEYNFFPAVIFPDSETQILSYNRVVTDLNGLTPEGFLGRLAADFDVTPAADNRPLQPETRAVFGLRLGTRWYRMAAKPHAVPADDPIAGLDVSILQTRVLDPVLGIRDPRTDQRIRFVGGIRGLGELDRLVDGGAAAAFALHATGIDQLMKVADSDGVMPPKSTWFEPKLRSGLATHLLD